ANKPMQPITSTANKIVWSDPTRLSTTFSASLLRQRVKVGIAELNNVSGQYVSVYKRPAPKPEGCADACVIMPNENQSIRTVISGSAENLATLKAEWETHKRNVDTLFASGNAGLGFLDPTAAIVSSDTTANKPMQPITSTANKIVWSDPTRLSTTFSASLLRQRVKVGIAELNNVSGQYVSVYKRPAPKPEGCADACVIMPNENQSIRTVISGSAENLATLKAEWETHKRNVDTLFASGNAGLGFLDPTAAIVSSDTTANKPMQPITSTANKIVWSDPTRLSTTFSASLLRQRVKVGIAELNNVSGQYVSVYKRPAPKPEGCADACVIMPNENQSIRTVISGSAENLATLKAEWETHKRNVDTLFASGNAGLGFLDPTAAIVSSDTTANKPMQPITSTANKIVWSDPTRLSTTFSASLLRQRVKVGIAELNNVSGQYVSVYKRPAPKPEGCADACVIMPNENQSIRTVISGSAENLATLKAEWETHKRNVDTLFASGNAGLGFLDPTAAIVSSDTTANKPMQPITSTANKIVWSDPTRLSTTFSASLLRQRVKVGIAELNNVSGQYVSVYKRPAPKPEGCADACVIMPNENQSIRTVISGSAENLATLKAEWETHKRNVDTLFASGNAGLGFLDPTAAIVSSDTTANKPMQPITSTANKIVWSDPTRLSTTFSASLLRQRVKVGIAELNNVSGQYVSVYKRPAPKPEGCADACVIMPNENQSIRTVISGSAENLATLKAEWETHKRNVDTLFASGNAGLGFLDPTAAIVSSDTT
nr:Chain A, 1 Coat Protein [Acinetobacter phage AP205]5LQP_Z Chain Z, Cryo-em Reconstruction Of Bacteriophage Ap205 Virus-like Particles